MPMDSGDLLAALNRLRHAVAAEAAPRRDAWQPFIERPAFAASADNLAHYLAFRHHDLRDVQRQLMRHGLSSLGRLESRVMLTLSTVTTVLAALLEGRPPAEVWPPSDHDYFNGEARLRENTRALLGGPPGADAGRILVTLGTEAATDPGYLLEIARRGADVVRINCAHDSVDEWAAMIENTRKAGDAVGRRLSVLMDLGGPKFRVGKVKRQAGERLVAGDRFRLV